MIFIEWLKTQLADREVRNKIYLVVEALGVLLVSLGVLPVDQVEPWVTFVGSVMVGQAELARQNLPEPVEIETE